MKRFLGFLRKEFRHIRRDKRTLLILLGMPVIQILLFGFAITNELHNADIAILDNSHDRSTQQITNKLLSSGYFRLAENISLNSQIEESFRKGKIKLALIFEPKFDEKLRRENKAAVQLIADASDPNTASTLVAYASGIIGSYQMEINAGKKTPPLILPEPRMVFNEELKGVFMFVPGLICIILMLISAMMTSISLTREKESGTLEVLMVSPLTRIQIVAGKVVPYVMIAFSITLIILTLGQTVFHVPLRGNIFLLLAEAMLYTSCALSLGIFISSVAKTQQSAMLASMMGLMLPTIMLSGFVFPIESMPVPLQILSNIIPARWFNVIIKDIMLKGAGIDIFWKETLVLAGMTGFFLLLASRRFKLRLE